MDIRDLSGLLSAVLCLGRWFCHSGPMLHPQSWGSKLPDPLANRRCFGTSWPPNSLVREELEAAGGPALLGRAFLANKASTLGPLPSTSSPTACAYNQILRGKRLSVLNKPLNVGTHDKCF